MRYDPSDLLDRIRLQQPDATEKQALDTFAARVHNEPQYLLPIIAFWFKEHYKRATVVAVTAGEYEVRPVIERASRSMSNTVSASVTPRPRAAPATPEVQQREKAQIETWKEQIRFALTMAFVMPNRAQLQHCNAGYVRQCGGVFTALVKGLPDNVLVGAHRTDDDLQNLCKRHKMEVA